MYKILVADDSAMARKVISDIITRNYVVDVLEAADGEEALEVFEKENPHFVFMDITMPKKNGLWAIEQIHKLDPNVPILVCSAMGQERYVSQAISLGAYDYIVKPFKEDLLLEAFRRKLPG